MDKPLYNTCPLSNLKRSFSVMQRGQSSPSLSATSIRLRQSPRARFIGDGLDHRQPVMSTSQPLLPTNYVDLTGSDDVESEISTSSIHSTRQPRTRSHQSTSTRPATRLPRYPNQIFGDEEVIDLDQIPDPIPINPPLPGSRRPPSPPLSPEVQFLHARPRMAQLPPLPPLRPPHSQQHQQAAGWFPTYTQLPPVEVQGPLMLLPGWQGTGQDVLEIDAGGGYQPMNNMLRILAARPAMGPARATATSTALRVYRRIADQINYRQVGFNYANVEGIPEPAAAASPVIEPLAPARPGFTRSPKEEDVLICPSCGDELSVGENEVKRQVWVVKTCGHVYCGGCAKKENRSTPKRRAGKATAKSTDPKPFLKCVVESCNKPVTGPKTMIQLFL